MFTDHGPFNFSIILPFALSFVFPAHHTAVHNDMACTDTTRMWNIRSGFVTYEECGFSYSWKIWKLPLLAVSSKYLRL